MRSKDPLSLMILLGFICQGFAWENYVAPVLTALLWVICLRFYRQTPYFSREFEVWCLFSAIIAFTFFNLGGKSVFRRSLDVGNALMVIQALWLLRPLLPRERIYSLAMAVTQLAIGAQVIVDYEFLLLLASALILVPKALHATAAEAFEGGAAAEPFRLAEWRRELTTIVAVMVFFFLALPRGQILTTGLFNVGESPLAPRMDMAAATMTQSSDRTLFQISGDDIGYLKSYALDTFDGRKWTASKSSLSLGRRFTVDSVGSVKRRVEVKNVAALANTLPSDRATINVKGDFFLNRYISEQGGIFFVPMWGRTEGAYEYWTVKKEFTTPEFLTRQNKARYSALPQQSEKLVRWLEEVVGTETDTIAVTRKLENYLKTNFTYDLGAPSLEPQSPLEDFIFNQRRGHCERFASALAILLRMRGIPSRVVIGYVPGSKNQFADFHPVTPNDAHAWTEAHIEGKGWITLDGTATSVRTAERQKKKISQSLYDWVEYIWYSKIVNLTESDQKSLVNFFSDAFTASVGFISTWRMVFAPLAALLFMIVVFSALFQHGRSKARTPHMIGRVCTSEHSVSLRAARGFYGRMLKLLERKGLRKTPSQTPLEFQTTLSDKSFPLVEDAGVVAKAFCDATYGGKELPPDRRASVDNALDHLRK